MDNKEVENLFFVSRPTTAADQLTRRRRSKEFRPPPDPTGQPPYHFDLATVLPRRAPEIQAAGRLVLHMVGDTGGVNGVGAQQNVADHMGRQIYESDLADQPSFCYHLGDVIYKNGEDSEYYDQFYYPYEDYPAPIFAIPGNHDGKTLDPEPSLGPFMKHFCSRAASHTPEAGESNRPTMIQPNCYWRLEAPFLTVVGLYSNVSGELDDPDSRETTQRDWLVEELRTAPDGKCLVMAVHHPVYSLTKRGGNEPVQEALEHAISVSGRVPDAVFMGHDHNYQRFTRKRQGRRIPYLVVGAGGYAGYDLTEVDDSLSPPPGVKLKAYDDDRPGFLRLAVTVTTLTGEYFTVPKPGKEHKPEKLRDRFVLDLQTHRFIE
jgi:hypothetical protein